MGRSWRRIAAHLGSFSYHIHESHVALVTGPLVVILGKFTGRIVCAAQGMQVARTWVRLFVF